MIQGLTIPALVAASNLELAPLTAFEVTGLIDLTGFLVAIWTFWSTTSLLLGPTPALFPLHFLGHSGFCSVTSI